MYNKYFGRMIAHENKNEPSILIGEYKTGSRDENTWAKSLILCAAKFSNIQEMSIFQMSSHFPKIHPQKKNLPTEDHSAGIQN